MTNEPVQNINGVSEEQKVIEDRAKRIVEILEEEPKTLLRPFLRFTEVGVIPDIKLILKKQNEQNTVASNEGTDGAGATGSKIESPSK